MYLTAIFAINQSRIDVNIHYENVTMQYTEIFSAVKIKKNINGKNLIFLIFLLKTLIEGGSNEYPQSKFWFKKKEK